jgi:xanthine dehydrogenase accessory factor
MDKQLLVLIKGAGDLATGVAVRLFRCGFAIAMTEIERPLTVRRTVAFAQAIFDGQHPVEGIRAQRCQLDEAAEWIKAGVIPVIIDPTAQARHVLHPTVVVDAIMEKRNTGSRCDDAPLVIALGPGFCAGEDCHAVVETHRGHSLGRVIWQGRAEADTGEPGQLPGAPAQASRVLRSPIAGYVQPQQPIGTIVSSGALLATVQGELQSAPILAPFAGILRGLIHPSVPVTPGLKIGDLDPRAEPAHCYTVSDKSLAVAGGVLEAILTFFYQQ